MRRAVIVVAATVAGLAFVLGYHPKPEDAPASSTVTGGTSTPAASASPSSAGSSSGSATGTQTVTGTDEPIGGGSYGDIQVKVNVTNGKITAASTAALNTNDPRSQQIEQAAVPQLEQQTVSAQSANIQGVSGATYTTQAYEASLQSALDQLSQS
jgi:uncharacterized protein with FMN-binding domain